MKAVALIAMIVGVAVFAVAEDTTHATPTGTCQCAAFKDEEDGKTGTPLVAKTPGFKVICDLQGKEECKKMCIALAEAAKEKVPKVLCEALKTHVDSLKPAAFYKACDAPQWNYTGLSATDPICCHEGKPEDCAKATRPVAA